MMDNLQEEQRLGTSAGVHDSLQPAQKEDRVALPTNRASVNRVERHQRRNLIYLHLRPATLGFKKRV
jgi:hypothetical protein